MQYRQYWTKRIGLALVVAATGSLATDSAEAAGHKGRSGHGQPQGPIFKTLDALAGGIESVLERTVLSGRKSSACDAAGCDDACDHGTLQQLDAYWSPGASYGQGPMSFSDESTPQIPQAYAQPHSYGQPQAQPSSAPPVPNGSSTSNGLVPSRPLAPSPQSVPSIQPVPRTQSAPSTLPRVSADPPTPRPLQDSSARPLSTEEGWIESFNPSQPSGQQPAPRAPRSQPRQGLSDPFSDDSSRGF